MKDEIIICDCSSAGHQMVLRYDEEDKVVYVEIHLVPLVWYKRLWLGIKYILGYKCCYGNFEEMILTQKHAYQVYKLWAFLFEKKGDNDETTEWRRTDDCCRARLGDIRI